MTSNTDPVQGINYLAHAGRQCRVRNFKPQNGLAEPPAERLVMLGWLLARTFKQVLHVLYQALQEFALVGVNRLGLLQVGM